MAKRQTTIENVTRIDGEGKVHSNAGGIIPLCKFRGHDAHTWVTTEETVDCGRCVRLSEKREEARKRLEYAADVRDTQDMDYSQGESSVIPAETPVKAQDGSTVTVPVDYDNPTAGRRELDASKGERILSEDDMTALLRKVRARLADEKPLDTAQWAEIVTQAALDSHFAVTLYEPKNGPALECEIPPLPEGVNPNTWELAHQGNTESARAYHMRQAKAQEAEYAARNGDDVPPF